MGKDKKSGSVTAIKEKRPVVRRSQEVDMGDFAFNLGDVVRDRITGFEGTILCRSDHMTGCTQYAVHPPVKADGSMAAGAWLDEDLLELLEERPNVFEVKKAGGPHDMPTTNNPV